jgi:general secretion pathway protein L
MTQATANPHGASDANLRSGLRAGARSAIRRLGLPSFARWWAGELAPLIPAAPRAAWQRRRARPVLAVSADAAVLWAPVVRAGSFAWSETARIPLSGDPAAVVAAGRAAIDRLARGPYGGATRTPIAVALPPGQVLRKRIVLPAAVEENLRQTLSYDLDRHTPFRPEDLVFDAIVVARDGAKREIQVDWAAALRTHVAEARRLAESFGATVAAVRADSPSSGSAAVPTRLNLLPDDARPATSTWLRWQFWLPLTVLAAVAAFSVALPIWQKRDLAITLQRQTDQAKIAAEAADVLRRELDQKTGDYNLVLARKHQFPSSVQLLDDITKLMPDDTWLLQLELKSTNRNKEPQKELLIRGESASAGRLVAAFEESKLFTEAAPRSQTTKIQPGTGEIFDLGALLKPLPAPARVPLDVGPPVAAGDTAAPAAAAPPAKAEAAAAGPGGGAPQSAPAAGGVPPAVPVPSAGSAAPAPSGPAAPAPSGPAASAPAAPRTAAPAPASAPAANSRTLPAPVVAAPAAPGVTAAPAAAAAPTAPTAAPRPAPPAGGEEAYPL